MKYGLPIIIIVIALLVLGGSYIYRASQGSSITAPVANHQNTQESGTGSGFGNAGSMVTTPTPAALSQITLTVTTPVNNSTVTTPAVTVSGKTVANADVAVNDVDLKADARGNFSTSITLDEGENTIVVVASDADGNVSEQELTVTYAPAQ